MSSSSASRHPPLSLDQLIALNDEIAALARAGAPLSSGLRELGGDMPGRLGSLARALSERLERGESLADAVSHGETAFPPLYRAVVAAGLRSGRLTAALEGIAFVSRRLAELRRMIGAALIYPTIVITLAGWMFIYFLIEVAPALAAGYAEFNLPVARPARWLMSLGEAAQWWWALAPLVFPVALVGWWLATRRATLDVSPMTLGLGWSPSARSILRAGRLAVFSDTLALMVEHQTPLDEAVTLAAQASGDRRLSAEAQRLADSLRRGVPAAQAIGELERLPPLLRWLTLGARDAQLCRALRLSADSYRRQALRQARWLAVWLPLFLTGLVGGGVTLLYAATVLGPWFTALKQLGQP